MWKDITVTLRDWGFEMNPCDKCVANKDIYGSQCTILWHVDYLKTSHMESKVVDDIINMLNLKI